MIARILALVLAATATAFAQESQPPAPGPAKETQEQQKLSPKKEQGPNPSDAQSAPAPASPVLPVAPQQTSQENEPTDDNERHSTPEWWPWTDSNFWIALFTFALTLLGYFQYKTSQRTNELTMLIERSYLSIGKVELAGEDFENGHVVSFRVSNKGRTPAVLDKVIFKSAWVQNGHKVRPIDPSQPAFSDGFIPPGGDSIYTATFDSAQSKPPAEVIVKIKSGEIDLWLFAHIDYRDDVSTRPREIGMAFKWTADKKQFVVVSDPSYNYMRDKKQAG